MISEIIRLLFIVLLLLVSPQIGPASLSEALAQEFGVQSFRVFSKDNETFLFEALVTSDFGAEVGYRFDFGDGGMEIGTVTLPAPDTFYLYAQHTFPAAGLHNVTFAIDYQNYYPEIEESGKVLSLAVCRPDPENGIDENCTPPPFEIEISFPKYEYYGYYTTEDCYYDLCWHDRTLSFTESDLRVMAETSMPVEGCRVELVEFSNSYTQNDFSLAMNGADASWYLNVVDIPDGLYDLSVVCEAEGVVHRQSTWETNNTTRDGYSDLYYYEPDTSYVYLQRNLPTVREFQAGPDLEDRKQIMISFVLDGMKKYDYELKYEIFPTVHYYAEIKVNDELEITDLDTFRNSPFAYAPEGCDVIGLDENSTLWQCYLLGTRISSTHHQPFRHPNIFYDQSADHDEYEYYYNIAVAVITDAGIRIPFKPDQAQWARRAIVKGDLDDFRWDNIDPTKYEETEKHTYYDGDLTRLSFQFTNTGEVVTDYEVEVRDTRALFADGSYYKYKMTFDNIPPGESIYHVVDEFEVQTSCADAGIDEFACYNDHSQRSYWWSIGVKPINVDSEYYSAAGRSNDIQYAYSFKPNFHYEYLASSGGPFSDYMKLSTNLIAPNSGLRWFNYEVEWELAPGYTVGELIITDTAKWSEQYYNPAIPYYDCGANSKCFIPLLLGAGGYGEDYWSRFHHFWEFKAIECLTTHSPYSAKYIFKVKAGNHPHDQVIFSVTQTDWCG